MPDWSRIHRQRGWGLWTVPLACCSAIYGLGVRLRLGAYAAGLLKADTLPGYVVSIGNLTAGGTGKTPAAVMLARWAVGQGLRVAILSRGYGSQDPQDLVEVSDGNGRFAEVRMAGDEPSLMARAVPESAVIVSRDRYRAGLYAFKRFGSNFFILDDGFQHLKLKRDLDLVLLDAADPLGNGHLLPWGPLREPMSQLHRADAFILTRVNTGPGGSVWGKAIQGTTRQEASRTGSLPEKTLAMLKEQFPAIPVFCADHCPDQVVFPARGQADPPDFLRQKGVVAFAGIAYPELFKEMLVQLGAEVIRFRGYRDHCVFTREDLEEMIHLKEASGAGFLLTTEKDWMRIAPFAPDDEDLGYLRIRFSLLPGQDGLFRMVLDGLKK